MRLLVLDDSSATSVLNADWPLVLPTEDNSVGSHGEMGDVDVFDHALKYFI